MRRLCCDDCGAWHGYELAFCPECGTLGTGTLPVQGQGGCYRAALDEWRARVWRGIRGREPVLALLSATLGGAVALAVWQPGHLPVWLGERVTFSRILPVQVAGMDRARLARETARLLAHGFDPGVDFVIPEEGSVSFYRLLALPGECTWALLRAPSPSQPDGGCWEWSFHSLLPRSGALVSVPFQADDLGGGEGELEVISLGGSLEERMAAHRQAVFAKGGARPADASPRHGQFYRHYQRVLACQAARQVERGVWRRGRGSGHRPHCLHHPWAPAVRECRYCRLPLCDTCGHPEGEGWACAQCASPAEPGPASRAARARPWRRLLAAALDLASELGVAAGCAALAGDRPLLALLLLPMLHWLHLLLTRGATVGRRLTALRLSGLESGPGPPRTWGLLLRGAGDLGLGLVGGADLLSGTVEVEV